MKRQAARGWVRRVQETSHAMDIPAGLFTRSPRQIADGLRHAVMTSRRTKGTKFQSAMSMLNWFINRGGRAISAEQRTRLEEARIELRAMFGRSPQETPDRLRKRRPSRQGGASSRDLGIV